jgi:hypothetical protein
MASMSAFAPEGLEDTLPCALQFTVLSGIVKKVGKMYTV